MLKRQLFFLLALTFFLAACSSAESSPQSSEPVEPAAELPADTETDSEAPMAEEEPTPTPEPEPTNIPEPEPEPTEAPIESSLAEQLTTNLTDGCVTDFRDGVDYFPHKVTISYTTGFTIEYFDNYKVVTVPEPFSGADVGETYVLVQCGTPAPEGFADATIVETPITSFVSMSTTYLPYLVELDVVHTLVGVDSADFISSEEVRARAAAGDLVQVGFGGDVNTEVVLDLNPDLVMTFGSGFPEFDAHPKLREAGIPVALSADFLDTSPLGQAEWGKFIAVFYNQEAAIESWFDVVASEYTAVAALVEESVTERPTVLTQSPFDGTWYAPGGGSYSAQLLHDAGADYVFADDPSSGSLFLDFETVFDTASEADYWLDIGFFDSLESLQAADERYGEFSAFQNGKVYNNDRRTNPFGGNDYFESGSANPHLVLSDLVKIFHPELLPDHEFVYYRLVE